MWTNTDTKQLALKDPGIAGGAPYTEYMDYWSIMGDGIDYPEMDKVKLGWIADYESEQILTADRETVSERIYSLYPTDRPDPNSTQNHIKNRYKIRCPFGVIFGPSWAPFELPSSDLLAPLGFRYL